MNKKERILKRILYLLSLVYAGTCLYGLIINYGSDSNAFMMGLVACITPWIVPAIFYLLHWKSVYEIYICNVVFVYFASLIGSSFHGYSVFGFDKVVHFFSGLLLCVVSILLYMTIKKVCRIENKEDYHLFLVFINAMNLAIAAIWEFYEYALLVFFNNDAINHYSQGVHDSMSDMLCAMVGGFIITGFMIRAYRSKKGNFVTNLCEKFYLYNIEPHLKKQKKDAK